MAPLGPLGSRRDGSRAQLMLVTGLGLAALIIVLALVLNGVIFTENYASRDTSSVDTLDALRYEHDATGAIAAALVAENAPGTTPYSIMQTNVSGEMVTWSDLSARHGAIDARAVGIELGTVRNGTEAVQNASGTLDGASGSNWTVATGVTELGDAWVTVDTASLVSTPDATNASTLRGDGVLSISVTNGSSVRDVFVYRDAGSNVTVQVAEAGGVLIASCTSSGNQVTIDLVAATIDGTACAELDVAAAMGTPYSVAVRNGATHTGTYDITVVGTAADASVRQVLYDATIEVRYVTPDLTYAKTVRVTGGDWP